MLSFIWIGMWMGVLENKRLWPALFFLKTFEKIHKIHTFAIFNEVTDFCFVKLTAVFVSESRKKFFFRLCFDPTFCLFCAVISSSWTSEGNIRTWKPWQNIPFLNHLFVCIHVQFLGGLRQVLIYFKECLPFFLFSFSYLFCVFFHIHSYIIYDLQLNIIYLLCISPSLPVVLTSIFTEFT